MPYIASTKVYSVPGKQGEVRSLLEGRVNDAQKAGFRVNLATTAFGDDPSFFVNIAFATLTQADEFRASPHFPANDPGFLARLSPLLRQPARNQLAEALTPQSPPASPVRYNLIARIVPQPAHVFDVTEQLRARILEEQAKGIRVGLSRVVAGRPGLGIARQFGSMAALEQWIDAARADSARQEAVRRLTPMLAEPVEYEVREVLIPMPSA